MYTIYLSVGVTLSFVFVPWPLGLGPQWTALPAIALGVVTFVWVGRRIARRLEAVTKAADHELGTMQQIAQRPGANTQAILAQKFDRATEILKRGFALCRWQLGVETMLNARIGMVLFARSTVLPKARMADSIPYLEKSLVKGTRARLMQGMWPAWAMLGVAIYKGKKDTDKAVSVLEGIVAQVSKESLLWSLYAWILWKDRRLDDAIAVLARAQNKLPDDGRIKDNLTALQNRKSMKMRAYGDQWYQFGLEKPKMANMQPQMMHPRARSGSMRRR